MERDDMQQEEIAEILMDCYNEDEELAAWEVAFQDRVRTPFRATLLGAPVEVLDFRVGGAANKAQCQVAAENGRKRWIGVEDLDPDGRLPTDFRHLLALYRAWGGGGDEEEDDPDE